MLRDARLAVFPNRSAMAVFVMISANAAMTGSYDYGLAALSGLMGVSASYAALDLAGRVTAATGWARAAWLSGGAAAMGLGIWSTHFIGMLAFSLAGSVIMGGGIAALHYIGMAAMRLSAVTRFSRLLVAFSIFLAIVFSFAALTLAFDLREETRRTVSRKLASATVMGAAISAMHYTGMASASFLASAAPPDLSRAVSITSLSTLGIGVVTLMVLGLAVFMGWTGRPLAVQPKELEHRVLERTGELTLSNEALAESEERFRRLVEALPDAIFVVSKERIVLSIPPA